MIESRSIEYQYENIPAFQLPDIKVNGGEELLILGNSGTGKTTLLNILGGLLKPQKGEIWIDGTALYGLKGNDLDKFRGKNIGIVFQKPHILQALTVSENIALPHFFLGKNDPSRIDSYLKELGIFHKKHDHVDTLSEGEAQRVSIARALANQPKVILADEPTASLDDENAKTVISLLKQQAKKLNAALIIVTHDQRIKEVIANHITLKGGMI
ncbi:MAG: ATP-binding cassette domain-containing protein [Cyclobacteriaceae bacterium]